MTEIPDQLFFYHDQYKIALSFAENTNCSDLIDEFQKLNLQFHQNKDEALYQKFEDNIKFFYRRGLPEWFKISDEEIKKSEGKYFDYIDVKEDLLSIRKKFEQNSLELGDYNNLLIEYKKLDSKIRIKKAMEKFQERQSWKFTWFSIIIGAILGFVIAILTAFLLTNLGIC